MVVKTRARGRCGVVDKSSPGGKIWNLEKPTNLEPEGPAGRALSVRAPQQARSVTKKHVTSGVPRRGRHTPMRPAALSLAAFVAVALGGARVAADCSAPESFGSAYHVDQHEVPPHLEDDALVVRVSGPGLSPASCAVPAAEQFSLTWLKEADMALLKLRRDAPEECLEGPALQAANPGEPPRAAPTHFVEIRVPLAEELKRGAEDFSRAVLALPPGGLYEAYSLYDNSKITDSARVWLEAEAELEAEREAEAEAVAGEAAVEPEAEEDPGVITE